MMRFWGKVFLFGALVGLPAGAAVKTTGLNDGDPLPGDAGDPLVWEAPHDDTMIVDNTPRPINANDASEFDTQTTRGPIEKRKIDQYLTESCMKIRANRGKFPVEKLTKGTQYYTPMFEPGSNGRLQEKDRRSCINMEGACIVNAFLYNWTSKDEPWGKMYVRAEVDYKFGKGNGVNYYNTTNALDPCRTLAADQDVYPVGTVIYLPAMRDKICPQSGQKVDGCFIVGDVGAAIKGKGRFDIFTGECANYDKSNSTCQDQANKEFVAPAGSPFYVVGRHNIWAKELREEADLFIKSDWKKGPL